jgi:hypothetical protein
MTALEEQLDCSYSSLEMAALNGEGVSDNIQVVTHIVDSELQFPSQMFLA